MLYEYLVPIYDKTFIYDVWSCRKGKGVVGAIDRTQKLLSLYNISFVWRADVKKFFDNISHRALKGIIRKKIVDSAAIKILDEVIDSYHYCKDCSGANSERERERERVKFREKAFL